MDLLDLTSLRNTLTSFKPPQYLFRGQNKDYPNVVPFIARPTLSTLERGQAYTICRRINVLSSQFYSEATPFPLDEVHLLALLQHYGWPTPFLDLTESVDVAIFFALLGHVGPDPAVVYVINTEKLPADALLVSYRDLLSYPGYRDLNVRWTVQQAYAIAASGWPDMMKVAAIDLKSEEYAPAVQTFFYQPDDLDDAGIGNIMAISSRVVAERLQGLLQIMCKGIHGDEFHRRLQSILWSMCP